MAFDQARSQVVLFGGAQYNGTNVQFLADTWVWNGSSWAQRAVAGPPAISGHAMAFDTRRAVTVMVGGSGPAGPNTNTWEWDGSAWAQRSVDGPPPRDAPALAFDAARGVMVFFGGLTNNTALNDTWEWDGAAWTQRSVSGPSARAGHAMAYDSARGVTVLFGGAGVGPFFEPFRDTWEWNGVQWMQRASSGPPGASFLGMGYDSARAPSPSSLPAHRYRQLQRRNMGMGRKHLDPKAHRFAPKLLRPRPRLRLIARRNDPLRRPSATNTTLGDTWRLAPACGSADFNGDGDVGTDTDIEAFFACLSGNCCPTCGSADFNGDGDLGTDADIEAFFRVLGGGSC